jgi:hypothetical protein
MKPIGSFSRFLTCSFAAAALLFAISAEAAVGRAVVRSVSGTASYAESGGDWRPLKAGRVLGPGATIRTGVGSRVDLNLEENGPDVRLLPETTLGLDRLEFDRTGVDTVVETQLDLRSGTIQGRVHRLAAASQYEVKTPNVVVGIRGTEYEISADGVVHVFSGSVVVVYINPVTRQMSTHEVNTGQTFVPPLDPAAPGALPTVRGTRAGEAARPDFVDEFDTTRVVVLPPTEPFISPVAPRDAPRATSD